MKKKLQFYKSAAVLLLCLSMITVTNAQTDFAKLDTWLGNNAKDMGGRAMLVIYKDGKLVYSKAANEMSARQKMASRFIARRQGKEASEQDYTISTREPIASCSKWLSAALIMTFVDENRIALSDNVGEYLPVLDKHGKGNITIGQCLSHTTGIKAPELKEALEEMKEINSMDDAIAKIAELPMEGEPGKVFHYSNIGLQIAAAIIEGITGKSFETLFAERIAQPLGMKNTDFGKRKVVLPAGGASSTPEDYLNFLEMILNKGTFNGKRILSEKSIAAMQVNRITTDVKIAYTPDEAGGAGYGYGEWIGLDKNNSGSTISSPGLFGSFPWVENEKKYAAFLMTYTLNNQGRQQRYKELKLLVDEVIK